MGQGLLVIAAAEEAAAGAEPGCSWWPRPRTGSAGSGSTACWAGSTTSSAAGRIGGAQALLGSLLSIKPVIVVKDGEVAEESKQRTRVTGPELPDGQGGGGRPAGAAGHRRRRLRRHRRGREAALPPFPAHPLLVGAARPGGRRAHRTQHGGGLLHRAGRCSASGDDRPPATNLYPWPSTTSPTN